MSDSLSKFTSKSIGESDDYYKQYIDVYEEAKMKQSDEKGDESTFPSYIIEDAKKYLEKHDQFLAKNVPGYNNNLIFIYNGKQNPYCPQCNNSLIVKEKPGYKKKLYIGICSKCPGGHIELGWQWQLGFINKPK